MPKIVPYSIFTHATRRKNICSLYALCNTFNIPDFLNIPVDVEALENVGNYFENVFMSMLRLPLYTESIMRSTYINQDDESDRFINLDIAEAILNTEDKEKKLFLLGVVVKNDNALIGEPKMAMHRVVLLSKDGYYYLIDSNNAYIVNDKCINLKGFISKNYYGLSDISTFMLSVNCKTYIPMDDEIEHIVNAKEVKVILS